MSDTLTTSESILGLEDRAAPTPFFVKAWGKTVLIRDPSGADRDEWDLYCSANRGKTVAWRAKVAQLLIVNEKDERVFSEKDIPKLTQKSAAALHQIWNEGTKRLSVTDEEVEEMAKN